MEEDYIKEKELSNLPKEIGTKELIVLLDLVKKNICKINCKDGSHGTGFFCLIPMGWGNFLTALMTNNHVLEENDIKPGKKINFTIDNDNKELSIIIDNTRKTYTNESYDVTIIEIKEEEEIEEKSFFNLDNQIFKENAIEIFKNCQIFLLHYPKGEEAKISPGIIKNITEDEEKKTIQHLCSTSGGSSGCPIINKNNYQVIGIHKGTPKGAQNFNLGTLLKEPIEKFKEVIKMNNNIYINNINNNNKGNNNKDNNYTKDKKNKKKKKIIHNEEKLKFNKIINNNKKNIEENKELNNTDIDEIIIKYNIYNIKDSEHIKIFGNDFVENNKNICKISINENEFELSTYIDINNIQIKNKIFEIKLKGIKNVTDMSYMFCNCKSLSSLPDIYKWNTQNVTNMSNMFDYCKSLSSLPDISKWNTQNVTYMNDMFCNCYSLLSLQDISKWNTQNVINMSRMVFCCESLLSLPDISKWDTQNITNMSHMFSYCKSLSSLPDISKWNTQNVTYMNDMFSYCKSLLSLPDISKWDTQNVTNMRDMFDGCKNGLKIPNKFQSSCFIF